MAAGLAAVLVARYMSGPTLSSSDPGTILLLIAAIGVGPAAVAAFTRERRMRERASLLSIGLVPAAAATLVVQQTVEPVLPIVLVSILLGWYVLPLERAMAIAGTGFARVRSDAPAAPAAPVNEPIVSGRFRDATDDHALRLRRPLSR